MQFNSTFGTTMQYHAITNYSVDNSFTR